MTLTFPPDPAALLAHLDERGILAHVRAAYAVLAGRGIAVCPVACDELEERILEHELARHPELTNDNLRAVP